MSAAYLATMIGFGLLGFDPTIALLTIGTVLTGAPGRVSGWFLGVALAGTFAFACVLALTVGRALAGVDWHTLLRTHAWPAVVEAVLAAGLLAWAGLRLRGRDRPPRERPARGVAGAAGLAGALVIWWLADPGFVGGVVAAGRTDSVLAVVVGELVWLMIAECLALAVGVVLLTPARRAVVERVEGRWERVAPYRRRVVTVLIGGVGVAAALDALWYAGAGHYLLG